jgi:hypothetical protein
MRVALDIETTGLSSTDTITCVAVASETLLHAWTIRDDRNIVQIAKEIVNILDEAELIFTYNGATFDIPFMQRFFNYSNETVGRWMLKLVDPLYAARALMGFKACARMSEILACNNMESKISNGSKAVEMAYNGQWEELEKYCKMDASLTYMLMNKQEILWKSNVVFSLSQQGLWRAYEMNDLTR